MVGPFCLIILETLKYTQSALNTECVHHSPLQFLFGTFSLWYIYRASLKMLIKMQLDIYVKLSLQLSNLNEN